MLRAILVPSILAIALATESLAAAPAAGVDVHRADGARDAIAAFITAPAPTPTPAQAVGSVVGGSPPASHTGGIRSVPDGGRTLDAAIAATPEPTASPKPKAAPKPTSTATPKPKAAAPVYKGTNRVWIPALGINRSVSFFKCTSSAYPGDRVYRWGCAGTNNVYLFGHAHSVFKPLHDAYVRGRLKKGMKVHYADANGKVRTYAVSWWKVTTPDKGEFAYASLSKPGMTLQTCVGSDSQYRLVVRLALAK
jgi:hypothetical protein